MDPGSMAAHDADVEPLGRAERKRLVILRGVGSVPAPRISGREHGRVAALASVSKQTSYKHFANKQALFVGVVESMTGGRPVASRRP